MVDKIFYTLDEAMKKLNCDVAALKEFVRQGKLREFRDVGAINYKAAEVDALVAAPRIQELGAPNAVSEMLEEIYPVSEASLGAEQLDEIYPRHDVVTSMVATDALDKMSAEFDQEFIADTFEPCDGYRGISYPKIFGWFWGKWLCRREYHIFDEVRSDADHYLVCDCCELEVHISKMGHYRLKSKEES